MTRLSNLQYPVLQRFATGAYLSMAQAQELDQRPFRSMLIRKWIHYTAHGFHITNEGRRAYEEFHHTSILRKDPSMPLTKYFDPEAYGLQVRKRQRERNANAEAHATA